MNRQQDSHLSDEQLLMDLDGELSGQHARTLKAHLQTCWRCRTRRQELEGAIESYVRVQEQELDAQLPPIAGPRALLKARLSQLSSEESARASVWSRLKFEPGWALVTALSCLSVTGLFLFWSARRTGALDRQALAVSVPDAKLTPGAALLVTRQQVCSTANTKNKSVPVALQRKVFEEYGIRGAEPRAYEVDYLITPALGGADDIHNLWPHSYTSAVWNARVKDALEDRLREMVCDGSLDLQQAQHEIATDWIAAYKKYFRTDKPLPEHANALTE